MFPKSKITQIGLTSGLTIKRIFLKNYSKQSVILNKLVNKTKSKRSAWRDFEELARPATVVKAVQDTKRTYVLNKLFMRHISDLMATGNCSQRIVGLGVEVTKIKISPDFTIVNVYWVSHGPVEENEVAKILSGSAGALREELTLLRVVGRVPNIQFVRDRSQASWSQVENLLKIADMGEDYVPRGVANLKDDFGNENINSADDLPGMRQNVLGVDRDAMLERILRNMKGQKNPSQKHVTQTTVAGQYQLFDQDAFALFLRQRKIMREKAEKYCEDDVRFTQVGESIEELDATFFEKEEEDYLDDEDDYETNQK